MAPHQREQAAVLGGHRIDLSPAGQEVMIDEPDHVKTVGHDDRLGKMLSDDRAVDHSQVHAHDPHLLFALKPQEIGLQGRFGTAEYDIVDAVILQVAHGGGVAFAAGEEVLVDAQDLGADGRMVLAGTTLEAAQKVALHGGGADALVSPQAAPIDAIQVMLKNHLLKAFAAALERLDAWQFADGTSGRNPNSGSCALAGPGSHGGNPSHRAARFSGTSPCFADAIPRTAGTISARYTGPIS